MDQIFYPTVHYTLTDIIPDLVLLRLLSPNANQYVLHHKEEEEEEEEEDGIINSDISPIIHPLSVNQLSSDNSFIDQDDEERRARKSNKGSIRGKYMETSTPYGGKSESDSFNSGGTHSTSSGSRGSRGSHRAQTIDLGKPLMFDHDGAF